MPREEDIVREIKSLNKELEEIRKKKKIECAACNRKNSIGKLTLKLHDVNMLQPTSYCPDMFIVCPICSCTTGYRRYSTDGHTDKQVVMYDFIDNHKEYFLDIVKIEYRPTVHYFYK